MLRHIFVYIHLFASSLVPLDHLDLGTIGLSLLLGSKVFLDLLQVASVVEVHLAGLHVLELWVVLKLLNIDGVTTDEKYTLDLKVWLFAEHAEFSERVLLETLKSLHETLEQVLELVGNPTLLTDLLVVEEPEGPAFVIDQAHHLLVTIVHLVWQVDEEGLEVVDDEVGLGEGIERVSLLLRGSIGGRLGTGSLLSWLLLLLSFEHGLDALLGHLDLTEDCNELWEGGNATKPGAGLSSGLGGLFDFLGLCFGGLLLGGSLGLVLLSSLHAFLGSFVLLLFIFDLFLGLFVGLFLLFLLLGGISLGLLSDFLALLCSLLLGTLSLGVLGFLFRLLSLFLRELGLLL